jgi:uncharacterized membrane protein YfcA
MLYCDHCTFDSQCQDAHGDQYQCAVGLKNQTWCLHKLLWPLSVKDIMSFLVLFVCGAVAAGGGIGGGGVFIPILFLLGGFRLKDAVPISNVMIAGASIANYIQMAPQRHPNVNRPLIYYDLAMIINPLALLGTIFGVMLNTISPEWLVLVLLIITLIVTVYRTSLKGIAYYQKEKSEALRQKQEQEMEAVTVEEGKRNDEASSSEDKSGRISEEKVRSSRSSISESEESNGRSKRSSNIETPESELKLLLNLESKIPWFKIFVLFGVLIVVSVHSLLVGGKGDSLVGVVMCTPLYWGLFVTIIPVLSLITLTVGYYLIKQDYKKQRLHYKFVNGDVRWTLNYTLVISALSLGAGILSSLLGIGGGMILSPMMLEMQVLPEVVAATSTYMILFTSLSAVVQFAVLGRIIWDYAGVYCVIGFFSAIVGQSLLSYIVKKYNKTSIIVFCIVAVISCSVILLGVTGIMRFADQVKHGAYLGFNPYCTVSDSS